MKQAPYNRPVSTTSVRGSAAFWDARYQDRDFAFGSAPNAFLASQTFHLRPGLAALVPGDGDGRNGVWLAEQGLSVTSVDYSAVGISKSKAFAETRGVEVNAVRADLLNWDWPEVQYDLVASLFLHLPPAARIKIHHSMIRTLRPGGLLILQGFTPAQLGRSSGGPPDIAMLYETAMLTADFSGLVPVHCVEHIITLDEGPTHQGEAAVIDLVMRKPQANDQLSK